MNNHSWAKLSPLAARLANARFPIWPFQATLLCDSNSSCNTIFDDHYHNDKNSLALQFYSEIQICYMYM